MSEVFTNKDLNLLDKTMLLRERIVDNYARLKNEELPKKPSELMAVVNLVESIDRSIFAKSKLTMDKENADDDKTTKALLRQLHRDLHENKPTQPIRPTSTTESVPQYKSNSGLNIEPGELIPKTDLIVHPDD